MKTEHESTSQKHVKNIPYVNRVRTMPYLTKDKSPVNEGEEHHAKMKTKLTNLTNHN